MNPIRKLYRKNMAGQLESERKFQHLVVDFSLKGHDYQIYTIVWTEISGGQDDLEVGGLAINRLPPGKQLDDFLHAPLPGEIGAAAGRGGITAHPAVDRLRQGLQPDDLGAGPHRLAGFGPHRRGR